MNNYGLFFSYGGRVLRLPVNPAEYPQEMSSDNAEYNVLGIGPITIPRIPKQQEISISSYFPGRVTSYVLTPNGFLPPEVYINFFRDAMREKRIITYTPVRYMEDGSPFATSDAGFQCTVESFTVTEKGGETGDFYYDLVIREYRDYAPRAVTTKPAPEIGSVIATQEPTRTIPSSEIVVGSTVVVNGPYYASSYGDEPHGNASGRRCRVSRIAGSSRAYPYHITTETGSAIGWVKKSSIKVVE